MFLKINRVDLTRFFPPFLICKQKAKMAGKIKRLIFQGSEMFINMINPHYPGPDMAAGTCQFRLFKNNPNVCQVRVDFVDTELLTPKNGNCVDQYMTITGTIWPTGTNRICGINPGKSKKIKL